MFWKFGKAQQLGVGAGILVFLFDYFVLRDTPWFIPTIALSVSVIWLPYWMALFAENKRQKMLETRFPDFVRNLTGAIKSGMPAPQAVIHVSDSDYGPLTSYVKKLANQLGWGIPFHRAFVNMGRDTDNKIIKRAIATMIQAERAGGNLEDVLLSITDSLWEIQKIKENRRSSIHSQIMQSYVIFFVFLGVMIIIQNLLIPYMSQFSADSAGGIAATNALQTVVAVDWTTPVTLIVSLSAWFISLHGIFLMIGLIQGFFAGAVLGKLAEGDITSGLKHSLILSTAAFVAITFAQGLV